MQHHIKAQFLELRTNNTLSNSIREEIITVKMHFFYFLFFEFWLYLLPILKAELMLKQIHEKTMNCKAALKCCALPFVSPTGKAVCKGHHCWRCDMFTTRTLQRRQEIPRLLPLKAPVKSSASILCFFFVFFLNNSITGSLLVCPFQDNLCELEQNPPLRAWPA